MLFSFNIWIFDVFVLLGKLIDLCFNMLFVGILKCSVVFCKARLILLYYRNFNCHYKECIYRHKFVIKGVVVRMLRGYNG